MVKKLKDNFFPYAFTGNVLDILGRLREASLPNLIDATAVVRIGVSEGNAHRTIAALRFLGLVDEEYKQTDVMKSLAKASTEDYPTVLGAVIRNAYSEIFQLVNPETSTEQKVMDAFRGREPQSQWKQMGTLFIGLCQEAGIMPGKPATADRSTSSPPKTGGDVDVRKSLKLTSDAGLYFAHFQSIFDTLPPYNQRSWSKVTKTKWLKLFESMLDVIVDIEE